MFFKKRNYIYGLDLGNFSMKIVLISYKKGKLELKKAEFKKFENTIFEEGIIEDKKRLKNKLNEIIPSSNTKIELTCALDNDFVVIRNIHLPYMENKAIKETLRWEFSDHLPFKSEDAIIDYHKNKSGEELDITAVLAPKNKINSYKSSFENYNLKSLNIQAAALLSLFKFNNVTSTNLILDIGSFSTKLIVGNSKNIYFIRNLKIAATELLKKENFSGIVEEELYLEELKNEVKRALRFYNRNNSNDKVRKIYLTGGGAYINNILEKIKIDQSIEIEILKPFEKLNYDREKIMNYYSKIDYLTEYSIAFGLCLSEVYENEI
ncbi:MAG: type IV pilus biogenesis protein PilM [Bacillota bacterium]